MHKMSPSLWTAINLQISLEEAIGYVASDELIEASPLFHLQAYCDRSFTLTTDKCMWPVQVTPKAVRLRKRYLDATKRKMMRNKPKD